MDDREKRKLERLNARYKRQNEAIKENYDRVSALLPKGTNKRIEALGIKKNALVKRLVLTELDRLEAEQKETPKADSEPPF